MSISARCVMKPSLSVVIPAFNEEENLEWVVQDTLSVLDHRFSSSEIIVVNDGSSDQTSFIANRLASTYPNIRVIHHERNMGLGYSVREGYDLASKDYVVWNPGDGGMTRGSLNEMFDLIGKADLIIPHIANPEFRSFARRFVSRAYVLILNFLFRLRLRCYNGTVIYRSDQIKAVKTSTFGFYFFSEALILLLKSGCSYIEVPTIHQKRTHGKSKAFTFKNIMEILRMAIALAWDVRFNKAKTTVVLTDIKATKV